MQATDDVKLVRRSIRGGGRLFVHSRTDPYALVPSITGIIRELSPEQPVERAATLSCLAHLHYGYGEVSLGVMPLFHTMGIRSLLMSVFQNGNFVCMPSFSTGQAFRAIERERISAGR